MDASRGEIAGGRVNAVPRPEPRVETAIRVLDRAASRYSRAFEAWCAFMQPLDPYGSMDWGDDVEIVRQCLGDRAEATLLALSDLRYRLQVAEDAEGAALRELRATRPRTDASRAAYRAAIERYVRRPTGDAMEAERALRSLEGTSLAA